MGHGTEERSGLCNNKLLGGPINQTEIASVGGDSMHGCKMAKFVPFLSLDCARVEGEGAQSKERKGSNFAA